jgi:hypothetical protein
MNFARIGNKSGAWIGVSLCAWWAFAWLLAERNNR